MAMREPAECIWPLAARLGEGPTWRAADDTLWFVDIRAGHIHCWSERTGGQRSFTAPELTAFVFPTPDGTFLCGLKSGLYQFDPATGAFNQRVRVDAEHRDNRLNDGYVDAAGRLWFGTMDNNHREPTGSLYRYDGRQLERMDTGYVITNGPAMSPDGRVLYHVDTLQQCVFAFDVDAAGKLANKRLFVTITEPDIYPDGPTVDSEGHVWIALYGGWGVRRYSPEGRLLETIALPAAQCTKVAFGGPDLKTMYITTAVGDLPAGQRARQPQAGGLFRVRVDVAGLHAHEFAGWD